MMIALSLAEQDLPKNVGRMTYRFGSSMKRPDLIFRMDHMIHFNGERFLGPYPDAMPKKP